MKKFRILKTLMASIAITLAFYPQAQGASSGTCGASCTWTLDDDGNLDIQGSGDMSWNTGYSMKSYTFEGKSYASGFSGARNYAPWDESKITTINIGKDITSIGATAFFNAVNLTSVTFEKGSKLKSVGDMAFVGSNDKDVVLNIDLPDTVESIGHYAFYYREDALSVNIPASLTSMGTAAFRQNEIKSMDFSDATNLKSLTFDVLDQSNIETLILPPNLEVIEPYALTGASKLTELILPETLKRIEGYGLNKTGITDLKIPASLEYIGQYGISTYTSSVDFTDAKDLYLAGNALASLGESTKLVCKEAQIKEGVCTKDSLTRAAFNGQLIGKGKGYYATYDKDGNVISYYANLADIDAGTSITKEQAEAIAASLLPGCKGYCTIEEALKWVHDGNDNVVSITW